MIGNSHLTLILSLLQDYGSHMFVSMVSSLWSPNIWGQRPKYIHLGIYPWKCMLFNMLCFSISFFSVTWKIQSVINDIKFNLSKKDLWVHLREEFRYFQSWTLGLVDSRPQVSIVCLVCDSLPLSLHGGLPPSLNCWFYFMSRCPPGTPGAAYSLLHIKKEREGGIRLRERHYF